MCGIVFAHNRDEKKKVNDTIIVQFNKQRERGVEGFGVLLKKPNGSFLIRAENETETMKQLLQQPSNLILFHHRFPTSSKNTIQQTHPMHIEKGGKHYFVVHNGVISNADVLRRIHEKEGYEYKTANGAEFNDSESLAYELVTYLESNGKTTIRTKGWAAFIVWVTDTQGALQEIYYGTDGTPLAYTFTKAGTFLLGSKVKNKHSYSVPAHTVYQYHFNEQTIEKKYPFRHNLDIDFARNLNHTTKLLPEAPITNENIQDDLNFEVEEEGALQLLVLDTEGNVIENPTEEDYMNARESEQDTIDFYRSLPLDRMTSDELVEVLEIEELFLNYIEDENELDETYHRIEEVKAELKLRYQEAAF
jgi:predicted glutamine amidotransferase